MSDAYQREAIQSMIDTKLPTFSRTRYPAGEYFSLLGNIEDGPSATIFYPVIDANATGNHTVVGMIATDFGWISILGFSDAVLQKSEGVVFVLENTHGQMLTFQINSMQQVNLIGEGDLHDTRYDTMMRDISYNDFLSSVAAVAPVVLIGSDAPSDNLVLYKIRVYPSDSFKAQFTTNRPLYYTIMVVPIFAFTSAIFVCYDVLVRRRQIKVMQAALQSNAIVASVFPEFVTSRLMTNLSNPLQKGAANKGARRRFSALSFASPKHQLRLLLGTSTRSHEVTAIVDSEPIADFFPNVTVIFADIAGFTAWSSEREPAQVFLLLETVYHTFDTIAVKHGVFKVETIGDCYVAVTGIPTAQPDHAVRMARFAYEIMLHMHELASSLESLLGPGTANLSIRVGLNSGSVTGGVLSGATARSGL